MKGRILLPTHTTHSALQDACKATARVLQGTLWVLTAAPPLQHGPIKPSR